LIHGGHEALDRVLQQQGAIWMALS
jgi:hypothetical protein